MTLLHIFMSLAIIQFLGWGSFKFQISYVIWSSFSLQGANYMEHYGLLRQKDKNGIYESVSKHHSWNSVSSQVYFKLQRHSDHHVASFRPY